MSNVRKVRTSVCGPRVADIGRIKVAKGCIGKRVQVTLRGSYVLPAYAPVHFTGKVLFVATLQAGGSMWRGPRPAMVIKDDHGDAFVFAMSRIKKIEIVESQ